MVRGTARHYLMVHRAFRELSLRVRVLSHVDLVFAIELITSSLGRISFSSLS